jgi:hypothetical protein
VNLQRVEPVAQRFDAPEERSSPWPLVQVDRLTVGGLPIYRVTAQPGWTWGRDARRITGKERCPHFHVKLVVSGAMGFRFADGKEIVLSPGQVGHIPADHDAWVVGDEPIVYFELTEMLGKRSA